MDEEKLLDNRLVIVSKLLYRLNKIDTRVKTNRKDYENAMEI